MKRTPSNRCQNSSHGMELTVKNCARRTETSDLKILYLIKVLFCCLFALFAIMSTAVGSESLPTGTLKAGNAEFSSSLYNELRKSHSANFVSSPISLSVALAMLKPGTGGLSAQEIVHVMKFPEENEVLLKGVKTLLESLNQLDRGTLAIANKIYVQNSFPLKKEYTGTLEENFKVVPEQLDFANPANAAGEINRWVSEKTNKKINHLFDKSIFDEKTRIVLVNALHFKGKWLHPFPEEKTAKDGFHISESETIQTDMMSLSAKSLKYANLEELNSQAVVLPFETGNLSMLILLPNQLGGIAALEEKLKSTNVLRLCQKLTTGRVEVTLPKFKVESSIDMKRILQNLGLKSIFNAETADLEGIFQEDIPDLKVSEVIQKAVIEINEQGAEAAAATGVHIRRTRAIEIAEEFNANHPFIFAILYSETNELSEKDTSILFYGSLMNPAQSKDSTTGRDEL